MEKEFKVERISNGRGHSNLLAIIEEAIPDVSMGSAIIVPYANGYKDPIKAVLKVDANGLPLRCDNKFAIVTDFIYEQQNT